MAKSSWIVFAVLITSQLAEGYKILAVFPVPIRSHTILANGLIKHLLEAGHEVTYISPSPRNNTLPNLRHIDVSEHYKHAIEEKHLDLKIIMEKGPQLDALNSFERMMAIHNETFHHPRVQKIILDPEEKFDIIIAEWLFCDLFAGFSAIFKVPFIWVSTVDPHWVLLQKIDQSTNPAYTTDITSFKVPPFSFIERIQQLMIQVFGYVVFKLVINPKEKEMYASIAPYIKHRGNDVPDYEELRYNASLVLGNSHVSMGSAMPLPQSYKPVGGYHIDSNVDPLPQDLQTIMDIAKHGVIYFSMGTMVKSKSLPHELKQKLVKMFGTLKQTIIWKFEEKLQGLPENLHIMQWAPQPSILAHPNCILFITHGGLLSSIETIHFGKPIIGIPAIVDQYLNVARAVQLGIGKKVDLSYNIADDLKEAIAEVISNPRYASKVRELSFIYHHRPTSPGQEIVHWVEHVVETQRARHLRSPALDLPFYQKFYLDLAFVILFTYLILKKIVNNILKMLRIKKAESTKKKK